MPDMAVTCDYARFYYFSTLLNFGLDSLVRFWSKETLRCDSDDLQGPDLLEFLWRGKGTISATSIKRLTRLIEELALHGKKDVRKLMSDAYSHFGGVNVSASRIIYSIEPVLKDLLSADDFRLAFLEKYPQICGKSRPQVISELIGAGTLGDLAFATVYTKAPVEDLASIWPDSDIFVAPVYRNLVVPFGLSPFSSCEAICDPIPVSGYLWTGPKPVFRKNALLIDDTVIGKTVRFSDILLSKGLSVTAERDPDVVLIKKDYFCPIRKRVVLHQGCAYGAPVYVANLVYDPSEKQIPSLAGVTNRLIHAESTEFFCDIQSKHDSLVHRMDMNKAVFTYNYDSGYIYLQNEYVTQGIQAKLLHKIIRKCVEEKRNNFTHREFIQHRDLITEESNTGFVTRLNRIVRKISELDPDIRIEKSGRGQFQLLTTKRILIKVT